jgi:predicted PurR-regulated permease PerM
MKSNADLRVIAWVAQAFGIVLFFAVLYVARDVFIPLALGILFAFLLSPLVYRLQRRGLPNIFAVLLSATVVVLVFSLFLSLVWNGFASLATDLPKYKHELLQKVSAVRKQTGGIFGKMSSLAEDVAKAVEETDEDEDSKPDEDSESRSGESSRDALSADWWGNKADKDSKNDGSDPKNPLYVTEAPSQGSGLRGWTGNLGAVLGPIGTAGLVVVFSLFALIYRDDLRDRFIAVISRGNYVVTTEGLSEAADRISRYLVAQAVLNISYGIVFALGLAAIGYFLSPSGIFPSAILLGTIAGLVRFVPYIGPLVGATVPLLFAVVLFPGYSAFFAVLTLIIVMELVSNNVLEPLMYGSSTGVSPVAIIIAAVFWGTLWGPVGVLLATPLTVCIVIVGRYVPNLRFFTTLLSEEVPIAPSVRAYQRLLAGDVHKLSDFLLMEIKSNGPLATLDVVVTAMIKYVLRDRESHSLNEELLFDQLTQSMEESDLLPKAVEVTASEADDTGARQQPETSATANPEPLPLGIGIAARHRGELLLLKSLAHIARDNCQIEAFASDDFPDREAEEIVAKNPRYIVIFVVPPGGAIQARYWCRSLRKAGYQGVIGVALLGRVRNFDRMLMSFRAVGAHWLATSVQQAFKKLTGNAATAVK